MTLEQVVNAKDDFKKIIGIARGFHENPESHEIVQAVYDYENEKRGRPNPRFHELSEAERNAVYAQPTRAISEDIAGLQAISRAQLAQATEQDYKAVLKSISDKDLYELVISITPNDKTGNKQHDEIAEAHRKYLEKSEKIQRGDYNDYLDTIKEGPLRRAVDRATRGNPAVLKMLAQGYLERKERELLEYFTKRNGDKQVYDRARLKSYLDRNMDKYSDEQRENALAQIGFSVEEDEED